MIAQMSDLRASTNVHNGFIQYSLIVTYTHHHMSRLNKSRERVTKEKALRLGFVASITRPYSTLSQEQHLKSQVA